MSPSIFVIGAGPQIAHQVASIFASNGFHVGLSSRSESNLKKYASMLPSGTKIATAVCDATDWKTCVQALDTLKSELGPPSVVFFNAGSLVIAPKPIVDMTPEDMEKHMQMNVVTGFAVCQWAVKNLAVGSGTKSAILITGGGLSLQPRQDRSGLAAGKAALLNLAKALRVETKGIHIATVIVKGMVDKGDPFYTSAEIAKEYWKLYEQKDGEWEFEIEH